MVRSRRSRNGHSVAGGGLSGEIDLDTFVDIPVVLNEWIRFDRVGTYRIQVESQRLVYRGNRATPPLTVTSSEAEFEIVPADPRWAARTLADAPSAIDRIAAQFGGRGVSYQELSATRDQLDRALRILRFLGTDGAARERCAIWRSILPTACGNRFRAAPRRPARCRRRYGTIVPSS